MAEMSPLNVSYYAFLIWIQLISMQIENAAVAFRALTFPNW